MPKVLLKTAAAHFATRTKANDAEIDGREARRIAESVLRKALRERGVRSRLSEIYYKQLVQVWQGAEFRLPAFVSRLNVLTNRHLPPRQHISLKTPPLTAKTKILAFEDAIFEAIFAAIR